MCARQPYTSLPTIAPGLKNSVCSMLAKRVRIWLGLPFVGALPVGLWEGQQQLRHGRCNVNNFNHGVASIPSSLLASLRFDGVLNVFDGNCTEFQGLGVRNVAREAPDLAWDALCWSPCRWTMDRALAVPSLMRIWCVISAPT